MKHTRKLGRTLLHCFLLVMLLAGTVFPAGVPTVKAQQGPSFGGFSAADYYGGRGGNWDQIDSVLGARKFFNVPDPVHEAGQDLFYRMKVGNDWETPTGLTTSTSGQTIANAKGKPKIQVFRYPGPLNYEDPSPVDHRNLTLQFGTFSQVDRGASALNDFKTGLFGSDVGPIPNVVNPVSRIYEPVKGLADTIFGGEDDHAAWVFTGDGNPNIRYWLTCNDQDNTHGHFVYDKAQPIETALNSQNLSGPDTQIADFWNIKDRAGNTVGRNPLQTALVNYLCAPTSKTEFDQVCQNELKLGAQNCPSDEKGLLDALGSLFNPIAWALDQARSVVGSFVGFVTDGLRDISSIGNLADTEGVVGAWKVMRDLVNLIFILILITIAFSTMLRIDTQKYGIRSLLPRLIFAVIGVNFSLLLVTILVNTATLIGNPFLSGLSVLVDSNPAGNVDSFAGAVGGVGQQAVLLLAALIISVVLLALLLLFIVRIAFIWILGALAPFAFLFSVLPLSRSLASQWLKQTIKWVYMAPIAYIVLWIGSKFLNASDTFGTTIVSILIYIAAIAAAIIIPLRLGGEVMQKAAAPGRWAAGKGAGGLWRRTGIPAAFAQRAEDKETQQAERGARLRKGFNEALSGATRGRLGAEAGESANLKEQEMQQREAGRFAETMNLEELEGAKERVPKNSRMRGILDLAVKIRQGQFQLRKMSEQAAREVENFNQLPSPMQQQRLGSQHARSIKEFSPAILGELAQRTEKDEEGNELPAHQTTMYRNLNADSIGGILEQGDENKLETLRAGLRAGRIDPIQLQQLKPDQQRIFRTRVSSHVGRSDVQNAYRNAPRDVPRVLMPQGNGEHGPDDIHSGFGTS